VRILPVAVCVALGSIVGTLLVVRLGNKLVVTTGLLSLSVAYAWVSTASGSTSYLEIAGQMVFLGLGMGLTSAPATESIMGAVQTDKAGIGSAVNDATREVGGTLGVAVIGSVFASLYAVQVDGLGEDVPPEAAEVAGQSVGAAFSVAAQLPAGPAELVRAAAERGFFDGLAAGCLVASGVALAGAVVAAIALPAKPPSAPADDHDAVDDEAVQAAAPAPPGSARHEAVDAPTPVVRRSRVGLAVLTAVVLLGAGTAVAAGSGGEAGTPPGRDVVEVEVPRGPHTIAAREYPGAGPTIVLLHGFPDHSALWEPLVERLSGRHVVTFDFLGWGASDKPSDHRYTFAEQQEDLEAVVDHLGLTQVAVVGHDAGVPAAINWALDHPDQAVSVTAMNGFYSPVDGARPPGLIALLALGGFPSFVPLGPLPAGTASGLTDINDTLGAAPELFARHFEDMENGFFARAEDARRFVPRFAEQFSATPSSFGPLRSLTADLFPAVQANGRRLDELAQMQAPLHLVWGAQDPYLTVDVPRALGAIAPRGSTTVLDQARHNLQIDEPERVAALLLEKTG
jgi:pimeloyl-ACP methyl ester carboxylesterase